MADYLGLVNGPPGFSEDLENLDATGDAVNLLDRDRFFTPGYFGSFGGATSSTPPISHGTDGFALPGGNLYDGPIVDSGNPQFSLPPFPDSFPADFVNSNISLGIAAPFVLPPVACLPSYRDLCDSCEPPTAPAPGLSPPSFVNFALGGEAAAQEQAQVGQSLGPLGELANPPTPPMLFNRVNRIESPSRSHNRRFCNQPAPLLPSTTNTTQTSAHPPTPFTTSTAFTPFPGPEPNSDDFYVSALAVGDYSSPSLPPFSSPSRPSATQFGAQLLPRPSPSRASNSMPRQPRELTAASQRPRRSSRSSVVDLTKEEHDNSSPTIELSSPMAPPPIRRVTRATATNSDTITSAPSRRRPPATQFTQPDQQPSKPTKRKRASRDDGTSPSDPSPFDSSSVVGNDEDEVLDLTKPEEPEAQPKEDHKVKLSGFQCVICMDDVSNLTVTHCGHMFCSECLHSALHIDTMKKTCPVCRTKVDVKSKTGKKDTKSYYHLELKLMTATRKGKQRAAG